MLEKGSDRFALAPLGAALRKGVTGSVRSSVLFLLNESHWRPWGHMLHSVRTGETAFDHVHGVGLFDYLAKHPEVSGLCNQGMAGNSPAHARSRQQSRWARTTPPPPTTTVLFQGGHGSRRVGEAPLPCG
jgi:hypothetical protein